MNDRTQVNQSLVSSATTVNSDVVRETVNNPVVNFETVVNPDLNLSASNLPAGICLLDKYTITEPLNASSGEADLYLCEYYGDIYVAKVYRRSVAIKPEVIRAIKNIKSPYVARIFDTGTYNGMPFEILPFYKSGSLEGKQFSYNELKKIIIPCINEALHQLHAIGVIHKDLKPSNIMLHDEGQNISIIDFGISSVINDGRTVLVTKTGMTPEYSAPETFRNVFLEESDYYSFGISLYELYCGYTPYRNMSSEEITRYLSVQRIPYPEDMPSDLKELISGLTYNDLTNRNDINNPNRRWTYEEVAKWCNGMAQIVPGEATESAKSANEIPAYTFNGTSYKDINQLVRALAENWENGKKQLFRGLLSGFFMAYDPEIAGFCMDAEEDVSAKSVDEDVAFWKLLYKIAPSIKTFYWKEHKYPCLSELGDEMLFMLRKPDTKESAYWNCLLSNKILSSFLTIQHASKDIIIAVNSIEASYNLQKKGSQSFATNYYLLAYLLSGKREYHISGKVFNTVDDLAKHMNELITQSFEAFNEICKMIVHPGNILDPQFEAWLISLGKRSDLDTWRQSIS